MQIFPRFLDIHFADQCSDINRYRFVPFNSRTLVSKISYAIKYADPMDRAGNIMLHEKKMRGYKFVTIKNAKKMSIVAW